MPFALPLMLSPQDFRVAAMLILPLSFGWKLFKLLKERRARKYVFALSGATGVTRMMSDERAASRNRWRRLLRRTGQWERPQRPRRPQHGPAPPASDTA